jgi:hypothetical protein
VLTPAGCGGSSSKRGRLLPPTPLPADLDDDLRREAQLAMVDDPATPVRMQKEKERNKRVEVDEWWLRQVRIQGLSKTYKAMPCGSRGDVKVCLPPLTLSRYSFLPCRLLRRRCVAST